MVSDASKDSSLTHEIKIKCYEFATLGRDLEKMGVSYKIAVTVPRELFKTQKGYDELMWWLQEFCMHPTNNHDACS